MDPINKIDQFDGRYSIDDIRQKIINIVDKINKNEIKNIILNQQRDKFKGWAITPAGENIPDKEIYNQMRTWRTTDLTQKSFNMIKKVFQFRITQESDIEDNLIKVYKFLKNNGGKAFKLSISFGSVLFFGSEDADGGREEFYFVYSPGENREVFKKAKPLIESERDYLAILEKAKLIPFDLDHALIQYMRGETSAITVCNVYAMKVSAWITNYNLGAPIELPNWITSSKSFYSLTAGSNGPYTDKLCFWRALAIGLHNVNHRDSTTKAKELAKPFYPKNIAMIKSVKQQMAAYEGVDINDIEFIKSIENKYNCSIHIVELFEDEKTQPICFYEGNPTLKPIINMAFYKNHVVYQVKPTETILRRLKCEKCEYVGTSLQALKQHYGSQSCNISSDETTTDKFDKNPELCLSKDNKIKWMIDNYAPNLNLDFHYKYVIIYDFEAGLRKINEKKGVEMKDGQFSTTYTTKHIPISVAVVDGLNRTPTVIKNSDPFQLIRDFYKELCNRRFNIIMKMKAELQPLTDKIEDDRILMKDFDNWIEKTPVLGYNSSFYDSSLCLEFGLFHILNDEISELNKSKASEKGKKSKPLELFTIKKGNRYAEIQTHKFKFLDIGSYQVPTSLEKYIEAYNDQSKRTKLNENGETIPDPQENKYPFMYEKIEKYDDLNTLGMLTTEDLTNIGITGEALEQYLKDIDYSDQNTYRYFKIEDFHSNLKPSTEAEYKKEYKIFTLAWVKNKCRTWMDYLIFYNSQDVLPLLDAFDKQRSYYFEYGLDLVGDGISLPSIATNIMYQFGHNKKELITAWDSYRQTLQNKLNQNVPIDPILFNKDFDLVIASRSLSYAEQDKERNEKRKHFDNNKININDIKKILTRDNLTCVYCSIKLDQNNFSMDRINCSKNHSYSNCVSSCTDCNLARSNQPFLKVLYNQFVYEYYQAQKSKMIQLFDENNKSGFYLLKKNMVGGPSIVFHRYHKIGETFIKGTTNPMKRGFGYDANALYPYCLSLDMPTGRCEHIEKNLDKEDEINEFNKYLISDEFAGFVEIDIYTPDHLKDKFKEFPPIFKTVAIDTSKVDIGEYMNKILKNNNVKPSKDKKLISSYFGEKILVNKALYKWYLNHGLTVKKIHSILKYEHEIPIFNKFVDTIADKRRQGDKDKSLKGFADEYKLIGNSAVGYTIIDKTKHKSISYTNDLIKARRAIQSKNFVDLDEFKNEHDTDNLYEIQKKKTIINQNTSLQVGIAVYMIAKLRMLEFYYDFLEKYHDYNKFQMCYMDTDSMYMVLGENSLRECLKTDVDENEYNEIEKKFMALNKYDDRTPGLFKIEKRFDSIAALCSKLYYCVATQYIEDKIIDDKCSSKGINAKLNKNILQFDKFAECLKSSKSVQVLNKGFKIDIDSENKTRHMKTYETYKKGLNPIYFKRIVENDGISTRPLDI